MAELSVRLLALLGKMADKGDEEDVHKLRTTVRRLEVQLGQCPPKIAKSLKSLRRKAGKVRDVDVHLGLLRSSLFTGPAAAPNAAAVCDKLRRALESERERHVEALLRVVEDAAPLLEARLPKVVQHAAKPEPGARAAHHFTNAARLKFLQWTRSIPEEGAPLHRLRIDAKKLRYSLEPLELHGEAAELTAQLKQVQDAIGCWHDWATLQQRALEAFDAPHRTPDSAHLCAALRARAALQYRQARHIVRSVRASLVGARPAASATSKHAPQTLIRKVG
jgi:CHAD domain-containing protein